jgi:WD40 repeat protein
MEALGRRSACVGVRHYPALDAAQEVSMVACSYSGKRLAIALLSGVAVLHDDASLQPAGADAGAHGEERGAESEVGSQLMLVGKHTDALTAVQWAPGDERVATSSLDGTICIWCTASGLCLQELKRTVQTPGKGRTLRVPQRCCAGSWFDVVVDGGVGVHDGGELVIPGSRPSIQPLPRGTRVFEVVVPELPLVGVETSTRMRMNSKGEGCADMTAAPTVFETSGGDDDGVGAWGARARPLGVELGCLELGEAIVLPPTPTPSGEGSTSGAGVMAAAARDRMARWEKHGRLMVPHVCYQVPLPIPHSWDRTLRLYEMDQGIHLTAPRPCLGHPTVAAGPLPRNGARVTVSTVPQNTVFVDMADDATFAATAATGRPGGATVREVHGKQVWRIVVPDGRGAGDVIAAKVWTGHCGAVLALAYSPDGASLASASSDGRIIVWACAVAAPYGQRCVCVCSGPVSALSWLASDTLVSNAHAVGVAKTSSSCAQIWRLDDTHAVALGQLRHSAASTSYVAAIASWTPELGPQLGIVATSATVGQTGDGGSAIGSDEIALWRLPSGGSGAPPLLAALHGHSGTVDALAFADDGAFLASGGSDRLVLVWDVSTLRTDEAQQRHAVWCCRRLSLHTSTLRSLAWRPTATQLLSGVLEVLRCDEEEVNGSAHWVQLHVAIWVGAKADAECGELRLSTREPPLRPQLLALDRLHAETNDSLSLVTLTRGGTEVLRLRMPSIAGRWGNTWGEPMSSWLAAIHRAQAQVQGEEDKALRLPSPRMLVSGSLDQSVRVWELHVAPDAGGLQASGSIAQSQEKASTGDASKASLPALGLSLAQALERLVDQPWKTDGLQLSHEHLERKLDQLDAGGKNTVRTVRRAIPVRPKGTDSAPTPSESESGPVREALNLLAADIIRDRKGVIGVPARHEVAALHAMVWRLINELRRCQRVVAAAELDTRDTPLRGLRLSHDLAGLWRCWLHLGRRVCRWRAQQAQWGKLPLVVGVGGAVGAGKSVALQLLRLVTEQALRTDQDEHEQAGGGVSSGMLPAGGSVLQLNLDQLVGDQHAWWTEGASNQLVASMFGREGGSLIQTVAHLLDGAGISCETAHVVYIEGWRAGVHHPHLAPITRRLDHVICVHAPLEELQRDRRLSALQELSTLSAVQQSFFNDRRWVLNAEPGLRDGVLARGRIDWDNATNLVILEAAFVVDRLGVLQKWQSSLPDGERLLTGSLLPAKPVFPRKLDASVAIDDPDDGDGGPLTRRYRGVIDEEFVFTGTVETRRGKKVRRFGACEGTFVVRGGSCWRAVQSDAELEYIVKGIDMLTLMDVLATIGQRPSACKSWPLDQRDEQLWMGTVADIAKQYGVAAPGAGPGVSATMRLEQLTALAERRGLPPGLHAPPKALKTGAEKKKLMVKRLEYGALLQALGTARVLVHFEEFLQMMQRAAKPLYESRDRRVLDQLRTISALYRSDTPSMPLGALTAAVSKALTANPTDPTGLAQMIAYETDGGVDAVLNHYYRSVVGSALDPVRLEADAVVHYDASRHCCNLTLRDGHIGIGILS